MLNRAGYHYIFPDLIQILELSVQFNMMLIFRALSCCTTYSIMLWFAAIYWRIHAGRMEDFTVQ